MMSTSESHSPEWLCAWARAVLIASREIGVFRDTGDEGEIWFVLLIN
jgi:hypothetical protein